MKLTKFFLRLIVAASSIAGFIGGWALLAHAPKPLPLGAQPAAAAPAQVALPTLEPIPSLEDRSSRLQPMPSLPQAGFSQGPRLRSGGS